MAHATPPASTLRDALNAAGALPWRDAVAILVAIADALDALHAGATTAHPELTPENVVIGDAGKATLLPNARAPSGSAPLLYMSPEQIDARPLDARSDLYVAGLLFYEMLAGAPPFASTSPRALMNLQCTAEPPPLPEGVRSAIPRGVEAILFALLAKDPSSRVSDARALVERLAPFLPASDASLHAKAPVRARQRALHGVPHRGPVTAWLRAAQGVPNALLVLAAALLVLAAALTTYEVRTSACVEEAHDAVARPR